MFGFADLQATNYPVFLYLILLPLFSAIVSFSWQKRSTSISLLTTLANLILVTIISIQLFANQTLLHSVGNWSPPLGIQLYLDGLSLFMILLTAIIAFAVSVYASAYYHHAKADKFWPVFLLLLASLNALFLTADIFNLYVTIELMALSAVSLTALNGDHSAVRGALRYLLVTLFGSLLYLLGVALLYHSYGTVDIHLLSDRIVSNSISWAAFSLMASGLMIKCAIYPMHFWLPPAHASASAPVSALLSALVVKASFYILIRLWVELYSHFNIPVDTLFGALGSFAVLWGSYQALRQTRLKLLIAYSTVAQIGYFFLAFPLAKFNTSLLWFAVFYLILSHALAKTAMFMAAGNILRYGNHDRISDLDRVVQRLPLTAAAFAIAGVSIIGLPPSGGFIGKWLILKMAIDQGNFWIVMTMLIGSLLAAAYVFKVLGHTFTSAQVPHEATHVPRRMQWIALILAVMSILLAFISPEVMSLLNLGSPFGNSNDLQYQ